MKIVCKIEEGNHYLSAHLYVPNFVFPITECSVDRVGNKYHVDESVRQHIKEFFNKQIDEMQIISSEKP